MSIEQVINVIVNQQRKMRWLAVFTTQRKVKFTEEFVAIGYCGTYFIALS